jgi:putative transposase
MTNHVHILVTPESPAGCAGMMHAVAQRYAHYFNSSDERSGALWEGRFRSCIVESDEYLLACYRYIELNPVRARMVAHPEGYPWSSYAVNSGSRIDPLISAHPAFATLPRAAYRDIVRTGLQEALVAEIRAATNGGYPLASETFKADFSKQAGRRVVPGRAGRPRKADEEKSVDVPDFFSEGGVS